MMMDAMLLVPENKHQRVMLTCSGLLASMGLFQRFHADNGKQAGGASGSAATP